VARQIREAVQILANHPLIGRRVETDYRELVISKGKSGYVALYRWFEETDTILILAIKHQLEAGYADDLWGGQG